MSALVERHFASDVSAKWRVALQAPTIRCIARSRSRISTDPRPARPYDASLAALQDVMPQRRPGEG